MKRSYFQIQFHHKALYNKKTAVKKTTVFSTYKVNNELSLAIAQCLNFIV